MAISSDEGDSKQALLDDLQSLQKMLNEDVETVPTAQPETSGSPHPNHLSAVKIPLLQDIFDPEHPEQEIQVEQLNADNVEQWVTGNLFDQEADTAIEQPVIQQDNSVTAAVDPAPIEEPDEPVDYTPPDSTAEDSTELTALYTEYADFREEQEVPPDRPETRLIQGLSPAETEEFIELLIEEHADDILALLKDILKDQLSLLVTQVRDNDSISEFKENNSMNASFPNWENLDDKS